MHLTTIDSNSFIRAHMCDARTTTFIFKIATDIDLYCGENGGRMNVYRYENGAMKNYSTKWNTNHTQNEWLLLLQFAQGKPRAATHLTSPSRCVAACSTHWLRSVGFTHLFKLDYHQMHGPREGIAYFHAIQTLDRETSEWKKKKKKTK